MGEEATMKRLLADIKRMGWYLPNLTYSEAHEYYEAYLDRPRVTGRIWGIMARGNSELEAISYVHEIASQYWDQEHGADYRTITE